MGEMKEIGNDYTGGIFQSIGFKEFHKHLTMSQEGRESTLGQKAFRDGLELLKLHTRQYTKSQRKWINNRFLKKSQPDEKIPPIYKFDSTDVSSWNENVRDKAYRLLRQLRGDRHADDDKVDAEKVNNRSSPANVQDGSESLLQPESVTLHRREDETSECLTCRRFFTSKEQLQQHLSSKQHRKTAAELNEKRAELSRTIEAAVEAAKRRGDRERLSDDDFAGEAVADAAADADRIVDAPITTDATRLAADIVVDGTANEIRCLPCKRKFDSEEKLVSHVASKKHRKKLTNSATANTSPAMSCPIANT